MSRIGVFFILLFCTKAVAQWCPVTPPPYHDLPKDCSPYMVGDPVTIHSSGTYSWHRPLDISMQTPVGEFRFGRLFSNSPEIWRFGAGRDFLRGGQVPTPFGYSTLASTFWWHSLFGAASNYAGVVYVTLPNGGQLSFRGCNNGGVSSALGCPGWRPHDIDSPGERARLWEGPDAGSLDLYLDDGRHLHYSAAFAVDGGTPEQLFLSSEFTSSGRQLYSVAYAQPGEACPGTSGPPFVKSVSVAGGGQLQFGYLSLYAFTGCGAAMVLSDG